MESLPGTILTETFIKIHMLCDNVIYFLQRFWQWDYIL